MEADFPNKEFSAYPTYRTSGLPWLGAIPAHWNIRRCRFLFREVDQRSAFGLETHLAMSQIHGLIPSKDLRQKRLKSESYAGGKVVKAGDLVLNRLKAHLGVFARAKQKGVVSPDYSVFRPIADERVAYFEALFKTPVYVAELRRSTKGIVEGFWRLYTDDFYDIPAVLPPRDEQDQIVAYLRAQDAKIARFIRDKRKLIELLNEQKQALIHRAVTRGLDPAVRLKPSGVEWLGKVPEHWELRRLQSCITAVRNGSWGDDPTERNVEDHLTCIRAADFDMNCLAVSTKKLTTRAIDDNNRNGRLLQPGDLILEKSGGGEKTPVGRVIAFTLTEQAVCSNFLARISVNRSVIRPEYLLLLMSHLHAISVVIPWIKQTTGIQNLDASGYLTTPVAVPSLLEQEKVLVELDIQIKPINVALTAARQEIALIHEYREQLITDVVTGQVDVRNWTPGPDDITDDDALAALDNDENNNEEEFPDDDGHE